MKPLPSRMILPGRTLFGRGTAGAMLKECARFGQRGMLVHTRSSEENGSIRAMLAGAPSGLEVVTWRHTGGEPTLDQLSDLLDAARRHHAQWIAGIGGGSVLDLAKACAGFLHTAREPAFYHDGGPLERGGVPFIAAPTTAGSGAEATPNAVLTNAATGQKKSIRDESLTAQVVILDPNLLKTCPKTIIAASGMDAFAQAVEAYSSRHASALSDVLALKGLGLISANIEATHDDPSGEAAEGLLAGSYVTGVALSNARLGVVHGLAHPLGRLYGIPHGLVCAICLPHAITFNRPVLGQKYDAMSAAVGGDLLERATGLVKRFGIRSPFSGQPLREKERIVAETLASGSTAANPRTVTAGDVEWFLARIFNEGS